MHTCVWAISTCVLQRVAARCSVLQYEKCIHTRDVTHNVHVAQEFLWVRQTAQQVCCHHLCCGVCFGVLRCVAVWVASVLQCEAVFTTGLPPQPVVQCVLRWGAVRVAEWVAVWVACELHLKAVGTTGLLPKPCNGTYEWVVARTHALSHVRMNEAWHIWMRRGTYEWGVAHMNKAWHIWMSRGTYEPTISYTTSCRISSAQQVCPPHQDR